MKIRALFVAVLGIAIGLLSMGSAQVSAAGVNDFTITDYAIDYYIAKDSAGRSTLKTVERITAAFPQTDQNHGIERAIPLVYDGHKTDVAIQSVRNAADTDIPYTTRESNANTVLRIGDAHRYVRGTQTYVITYTQRDVTRAFADTGRDEWYWDTNGTEWAVPIKSLVVRVHLDASVAGQYTGTNACYTGVAGSTDRCVIEAAGWTLTARAETLAPGENITLAVGFDTGTFAAYQPTIGERLKAIWLKSLFVTIPTGVGLIVWFSVRFTRRSDRTAEIGTIVPEYLPPKDTSVVVAGAIAKKAHHALSAQLIDLAVRRYLKIYQTREARWWRSARYELEITADITGLREEEQEILRDIFPDTAVGTRLALHSLRRNAKAAKELGDNYTKLQASIADTYRLRHVVPGERAWYMRASLWTLAGAAVTLSPALAAASLVALVSAFLIKPLTDTGLALLRYLKGLEMYIKLAEADRLKALQSPEGAQKLPTAVEAGDTRQLIKLYEKVLPYAILFGLEKQWNARLGAYYEDTGTTPAWMTGTSSGFQAAAFSSAISSFNTTTSYSDPSSSSSGGSGGGGSSGGGGGGGGGGGW